MIENFTPEEREIVALQLALENNALLRIVVAQQVKLMEKLGITDFSVDEAAFGDLGPAGDFDLTSKASAVLKVSGLMAEIIRQRAHEWVQLKT